MKYTFFLFLLISNTVAAQTTETSTISNEELSSAQAAYTAAVKNAFTTAYHIDGATIKFLIDNEATAVQVSHGLTNTGQKVIILSAIGGNEGVANKQFIQYETNLCPPACDAAVVPAIKIDGTTANKYLTNFNSSRQYESVKSFKLSRETVRNIGSGRNLRVYNVIEPSRTIAVTTSGYNTTIYLEPPTTLCPPACD